MTTTTKYRIMDAMEWAQVAHPETNWEMIKTIRDAYLEAIAALKETDKALAEVTMYRSAYDVSDIQNSNKAKGVLAKAPEKEIPDGPG